MSRFSSVLAKAGLDPSNDDDHADATTTERGNDRVDLADVRAKVGETFDTLNAYGAEQREAAAEKASQTLSQIDDALETREQRLRENWAEMSETARRRASDAMATAREKRNHAGERLGELRQGAEATWSDIRQRVRAAYDDVVSAMSSADDATHSDQER